MFTAPSKAQRIKDHQDSEKGLIPVVKIKPQPVTQRKQLLWVGVDLDGTLATPLWTPANPTHEIGDPIPENISKVYELVRAGFKIIVHTSRPWTDYEAIENWLQHYGIPYKEIQCGKPLFGLTQPFAA